MYQKVLIPLDGSELAECSLEHAKTIIPACHVADVVVLQVVVPFSVQTMPALGEADDDALRRIWEQNQKDAEEYVQKVKDRLKKQGIAAQAVTVVGNPSDEILSYIEKHNVDLIVMSTHGRSGLSRFFFGSVAEKVSRHSRVPVLLITPEGCRKPSV